jgi:hypothetical protein
MAGLVPAIHAFRYDVDVRHKVDARAGNAGPGYRA